MEEVQVKDPAHTLPVGKNTLMAALAYVGPLVVVSYLVAKGDPFVKYHIKQGLVLFAIEVVLWIVVRSLLWAVLPFLIIVNIINLAVLVLSIIGIINAVQGNEKELPLVGGFGKHFPI